MRFRIDTLEGCLIDEPNAVISIESRKHYPFTVSIEAGLNKLIILDLGRGTMASIFFSLPEIQRMELMSGTTEANIKYLECLRPESTANFFTTYGLVYTTVDLILETHAFYEVDINWSATPYKWESTGFNNHTTLILENVNYSLASAWLTVDLESTSYGRQYYENNK